MRSRFVTGAWRIKSSTTETDDFPFLRQATAARRGIPRKRCRPTPPCLTHPPSCHPPFSPSGRRGLASDSPEGRRFSAAFSVSALASQFVLLGHRHAPWPHGHRRWPPASASTGGGPRRSMSPTRKPPPPVAAAVIVTTMKTQKSSGRRPPYACNLSQHSGRRASFNYP